VVALDRFDLPPSVIRKAVAGPEELGLAASDAG
jgi:hypothetical protein